MNDRTYGREKIRGYLQGVKELHGQKTRAAPYAQWPMRNLRRYTAWVHGWFLGRGYKMRRPAHTAGKEISEGAEAMRRDGR